MRKLLFLFSALIACGVSGFSQTATIRGTVYNENNGEAVIFALVYLEGTSLGVQTDVNGFFSLTKIPAGTYVLVAQQTNFTPAKDTITVKAGEIVSHNLTIAPRLLKEVIIRGDKENKVENPAVGKTTMDRKDINRVVAVGGVADIAQSVQVLPGVISSGDQGGQLYIRGGTPIQNKVLLDGMIIYNPFHSIGLFSVFDTDIIKNMDVYTGGFNAEYGGRVSSVMDISTRDGNRKRFGGKVTLSPFGAKLMIEGPLKRMDEKAGKGSISYMLSAKNSYLKQTSKVLYSYVDTAGLPFNFNDYYGKVSFNSTGGSRLSLFGFNFNDRVTRYKGSADLKWDSWGFGSAFQVVPNSSTTLIRGNFAYSQYVVEMIEDNYSPRTDSVNGFNLGLNFTYFQRKNVVNYGIEVLGYKTVFQFENSVRRTIEQRENTTEFAAYFKYKWVSNNMSKDTTKSKILVLEPGFRIHYYASLNNISPEPRLAFKYNFTNEFRIRGAVGMYSQNLIAATSDRDVVNLFYGILSGSDNLPKQFTNEDGEIVDITHKLQKANHFILGFEWDPIDSTQKWGNLEFTLEGYLKDFRQLTNINRNKLYEDSQDNSSKPDILKKDFIVETGRAFGIDFVIKYEFKNIYFWGVYSYGMVTRWDGIQHYRPNFDRRHNVNIVGAYVFGKDENWEVDIHWNFGTGFPFTPTQGFYESINFENITTDYLTANGDLGILYGDLNSHQLPTYHRLDFTIKKWWDFSEFSRLEVAAGCTNAYNRQNVFYFDRVAFKRVNQLPLMPSVSMNLSF
ncbi:MAG TPA: TonB-dependent receptor [Bacteroidia bacterium]|nr:TonB-dependent receptor [Bacteroidia bacterium]